MNFNNKSLNPCEICHKTKKTRESFTTIVHNSKNIGYLIHLDVWGPYRKSSICQIFLTIVDDFFRRPCVYLIKSKEEVFSRISTFLNLIENQVFVKFKIIRSGNRIEFVKHEVQNLFKTKGVVHQTYCVYTSPHNGVLERKYRHILHVLISLLFEFGLPIKV